MTKEEALEEIELFKQAAVDAYNLQHRTAYDHTGFSIYSINPNQNSQFAYRLITKRTDDYFILECYCYVGPYTRFHPYEVVRYESDTDSPRNLLNINYAMVDKIYPVVIKAIIAESGSSFIMSENHVFLTPEK